MENRRFNDRYGRGSSEYWRPMGRRVDSSNSNGSDDSRWNNRNDNYQRTNRSPSSYRSSYNERRRSPVYQDRHRENQRNSFDLNVYPNHRTGKKKIRYRGLQPTSEDSASERGAGSSAQPEQELSNEIQGEGSSAQPEQDLSNERSRRRPSRIEENVSFEESPEQTQRNEHRASDDDDHEYKIEFQTEQPIAFRFYSPTGDELRQRQRRNAVQDEPRQAEPNSMRAYHAERIRNQINLDALTDLLVDDPELRESIREDRRMKELNGNQWRIPDLRLDEEYQAEQERVRRLADQETLRRREIREHAERVAEEARVAQFWDEHFPELAPPVDPFRPFGGRWNRPQEQIDEDLGIVRHHDILNADWAELMEEEGMRTP